MRLALIACLALCACAPEPLDPLITRSQPLLSGPAGEPCLHLAFSANPDDATKPLGSLCACEDAVTIQEIIEVDGGEDAFEEANRALWMSVPDVTPVTLDDGDCVSIGGSVYSNATPRYARAAR